MRKWIIAAVVLAVIAVLAFRFLSGRHGVASAQASYIQEAVERRTIISSLSGSGTLQPANSYTVTTLVSGEILSAGFEEGDVVEKDTVLYQIDSSDVANNIEKSQISLNQAQRSYESTLDKLYVKAAISGQLFSLDVDVGDEVTQGQAIGTIRQSDTMILVVPFPADDAQTFSVGQGAVVTLDNSFETLNGTIKSISGSDIVGQGNMVTRNVTITVQNPGGLGAEQSASASVDGINCAAPSTFTYPAESTVIASIAGTVTSIQVKEGGTVSKDQVILTLGGDDLDDAIQSAQENLRSAELSMDSTQNQLDNYTITSPIQGTIVDKQYKAGDNVETGKVLCTIYDLSYLEMTINIDELDISEVAVGQAVQVTADAVSGQTYTGEITKVSLLGTTSSGGATSYPVTVRIDRFDGLRPGMNADAEIVLSEAADVLSIPNGSVTRGNLVLITADSPSASNAVEPEAGTSPAAPEGYAYVLVQPGQSDDDYIEILSGLTEGDTVAYRPTSASGGITMMMGPMGGMPSGGGAGGGREP